MIYNATIFDFVSVKENNSDKREKLINHPPIESFFRSKYTLPKHCSTEEERKKRGKNEKNERKQRKTKEILKKDDIKDLKECLAIQELKYEIVKQYPGKNKTQNEQ